MPYGTVNADVIGTSVTGSNLGAGDASLMKNRIINGAMVIDQRNAGASVTVNNGSSNFFIADRWFANGENSDGVYTGQQVTTAPTGFNNSLKFTVTTADSSIGATQAYVFRQRIEGYNFADLGWGTANAKTITLSFQVQSSVTGTFGGSLFNSNGDRCYPFSYTISSANTWTSISVTIAGDTTGTWLTTNGTGVNVVFSLGTGSTYKGTAGSWGSTLYLAPTGSVDLISTNGATFYITGVQLEVGSSATGFEYRMYSQEYDLCRRYYEQFNFSGSGSSTINQYLLIGMAWTATDCRGVLSYYPKRAQPSSAVNSGTLRFATSTNGVTTGSGWTFDQAGPNNVLIYNSSMSGFTTGQAVQLTGQTAGNISISAEL